MLNKSDLHPYQQRAVTELFEHSERLAIMPMGAGKTVSALTAFKELRDEGFVRRGIVIAPKLVATTVWPAEPDQWEHLRDVEIQLVTGTPDQRKRKLDAEADLYVVGVDNTVWLTKEIAKWTEDDPRLDLLIVDEMSRYKAAEGKRARALSMVAERFKNRWGLTGTPMPNNEIDLYQPVRILTRWRVWQQPFAEWRMKYFIPDNPVTQFHWEIREEWKDKIWGDIAKMSFTVDEDELPPQPELQIVQHYVDLPREAQDVYATMLRHLIVEFEGGEITAENMAVASGKCDQVAQGFMYGEEGRLELLHDAKIRMLKELLAGLDEQVLITYWFKEDLYRLKDEIDGLYVLPTGAKEEDVVDMVEAWNSGKIKRLAVHPASAGHGLNLQKGHAAQIVHYCQTWSSELYDQVVKRIARQGNKAPHVFNHLIIARGTLDQVKADRVARKMSTQDAFKKFVSEYRS